MELAKGNRALLQGRGEELATRETEGQMLARVCPELMSIKGVLVPNDEAHHCYREKPGDGDEGKLTGDDRKEAESNREAARVWISGLDAMQRKLGMKRVIDLSATPFFLRGSGYAEGTLFPWTVSDFSLMDAIECGIVKLPQVPVVDNVPGAEMPMFRNLWEHIGKQMPKRRSGAQLDPMELPPELRTALAALYGHYEKTFRLWEEAGVDEPPCFICSTTATRPPPRRRAFPSWRRAGLRSRRGKARSKHTADGLPVHSFRTLLADLATITRNRVVLRASGAEPFEVLTRPTALQRDVFTRLGVRLERSQ